MIQRIQSLFLLVISILMGVVSFVPFTQFLRDGMLYKQTVWGIQVLNASEELVKTDVSTLPMGILTIMTALLPLVVIFLYKKRFLQMRLCIVEIVLLLGVSIYMGMYLFRSGSDISDKIAFSIVDLFPILSIILAYMAFRRILKDELLVKSLDRIR